MHLPTSKPSIAIGHVCSSAQLALTLIGHSRRPPTHPDIPPPLCRWDMPRWKRKEHFEKQLSLMPRKLCEIIKSQDHQVKSQEGKENQKHRLPRGVGADTASSPLPHSVSASCRESTVYVCLSTTPKNPRPPPKAMQSDILYPYVCLNGILPPSPTLSVKLETRRHKVNGNA
ncbi:hypothetical protein LX36DRAFT_166839 [Colletotrichum falcatum]|nr:hypothetical protein LX36DRAFT_166839 [Colletotrichum falcatum]